MNTDSSEQDTGRNDSVLNLHHEEADRGREHKDVVRESVTEIAGEVVNSDDDASVLQGCDESHGI